MVKGVDDRKTTATYVIPDTREGWVESLRLLLESYFHNLGKVEFDYSKIRAAGEPISGFGGVASGHEPLKEIHGDITEVLKKNAGDAITITTIVDIMNLIGKCVVAGNVRRTAEIVFGDPHNEEYLDLKNYKVNAGAPISVTYRGNTVFAPGAPSGGGVVLLTALNILQNYKFKDQDSNATRTYHLLAESLRRGHNNRSHHIGDPAFYDVPTEKLISRARTIELLKNFKFKTATPSSKIKPMSVVNESRDTTHYSIVDSEGNAVSNTYTLSLIHI